MSGSANDGGHGPAGTPGPASSGSGRPAGSGDGPPPTERERLVAAFGGPRGSLETAMPGVAFYLAWLAFDELRPALAVAIGMAALFAVLRLAQRDTVQHAFSGFFGVLIAALIAARTGRPEDYFLPGILINVAYAAGWTLANLVRWPLLGVMLAGISGEGMGWRDDRARLRTYQNASWWWAGSFALRAAVQTPLYLAGATGWLLTAKVALGWPLTLAAIAGSLWSLGRHVDIPAEQTKDGGAVEPTVPPRRDVDPAREPEN